MSERLIDRELAAARQSLETLRTEIRRAPGLTLFDKFVGRVTAGPKIKSRSELAAPYLAEIEQIYARMTGSRPSLRDFKGIDEAIDNLNQEILTGVTEVSKTTPDPLELVKGSEALEAVVFLAQLSDADNPISFERVESLLNRFNALKLYKHTIDSEALQNQRDELLPDFLRQAQKWDSIGCKIESRKRQDQLSKIETTSLPRINLFTASDVAPPQIFVRQQRFLTDLISDLEEIRQKGGGGVVLSENRKDEINRMIIECEEEIRQLEADTKMDESSRRRRLNIVARKRDSLFEELESLY